MSIEAKKNEFLEIQLALWMSGSPLLLAIGKSYCFLLSWQMANVLLGFLFIEQVEKETLLAWKENLLVLDNQMTLYCARP